MITTFSLQFRLSQTGNISFGQNDIKREFRCEYIIMYNSERRHLTAAVPDSGPAYSIKDKSGSFQRTEDYGPMFQLMILPEGNNE